MNNTRLISKLTPPLILTKTLLRRQNIASMHDIVLRESAVILCSAPAGYGKSTVLAQYYNDADKQNINCLWLSLDYNDNSPISFLEYLLLALSTIYPYLGEDVKNELKQGNESLTIKPLLISLINELVTIEQTLFLFLDDLHLITDKKTQETVHWLIKNSPDNIHFFIATRTKPNIDLNKLKLQNRLIEYDADNLSFDFNETEKLFENSPHLKINKSDIKLLWEKTEGWIAALQLFSLAAAETDAPELFISKILQTNTNITDFLSEVLLENMKPEIREFLVKASLMDRFNADICKMITDYGQAESLLESLFDRNLFLIPLDYQHKWFRFHHLFSDFLRHQCEKIYSNEIEGMYTKISQWFGNNQYLDEAIHYAYKAKNYARAAQLINDIAIDMTHNNGKMQTLAQWAALLPNNYLTAYPRIKIAYAWALLFTVNIEACKKLLDELNRDFIDITSATKTDNNELKSIKQYILLCNIVYYIMIADYEKVDMVAKQLTLDNTTVDPLHYGHTYIALGDAAAQKNNFNQAEKYFSIAQNKFAELRSYYGYSWACFLHALICIKQNQLIKAKSISTKAVAAKETLDGSISLQHMHKLILGLIMYRQGQYSTAHEIISNHINYDTNFINSNSKQCFVKSVNLLYIKLLHLYDKTKAIKHTKKVETIFINRKSPLLVIAFKAERFRFCIEMNDLDYAKEILNEIELIEVNHIDIETKKYFFTYLECYYKLFTNTVTNDNTDSLSELKNGAKKNRRHGILLQSFSTSNSTASNDWELQYCY